MCRSEPVHKSVSELLGCAFDGFSRGILPLLSNEIIDYKDFELSLYGLMRESLDNHFQLASMILYKQLIEAHKLLMVVDTTNSRVSKGLA